MTITAVKRAILKIDPKLNPESRDFRAAVVLLSSAVVGPNNRELVSFTGYSNGAVAAIGKRCRAQGLWCHGKVYSGEWGDPESGTLAFWLDVCVARGYLDRVKKR